MNLCSAIDSQVIRSVIFGLQKVVEITQFVDDQVNDAIELCELVPCALVPLAGCTDIPKTVCKIPSTAISCE